MSRSALQAIRKLRSDGATDEYLSAARALAEEDQNDVEVQIEAAYACDRFGDEADAIVYYDRAWSLGIPSSREKRFVVGYGSTLRNVGRSDDAIAILSAAIDRYPDYAPLHSFQALALHAVGQHREAMAAAITSTLLATGDDALDGYERALAIYRDELAGD